MLLRKVIIIDMYIKDKEGLVDQNQLMQNMVYKDVDIDLELLFLTGKLDLKFGTSKDNSFTGLKLLESF